MPTEDCTNGIDDDCNGLTDCDDPACTAGFSCVDVPAGGWKGPFALHEVAGLFAANACGSFGTEVAALSGGKGAMGAPASCSACTCTSPVCMPAPLMAFGTANCTPGMVASSFPQTPGNVCVADAITGLSFSAAPGTASCTASPEKATVAPPTWTTSDAVCTPTAVGTCPKAGPGVCVAKAAAPLEGICVAMAGSQSCPAGFPNAHSFVTGSDDTRTCTSCSCSGGTCTGTTEMYGIAGCGNVAGFPVPNTGACVNAPNGVLSEMSMRLDSNAKCPPSGGAATGSVTDDPADTVTVCCQ